MYCRSSTIIALDFHPDPGALNSYMRASPEMNNGFTIV